MRTLFLLRGAPASGKSTWVKENELDSYTISTDTLRLMYQSPVTNIDGTSAISQDNDKLVWDMVMQLMEKRMSNGEFLVVDATHYKSILLNRYLDLVNKYRYRVYVVDFSKISEEELLERNSKRGFRKVPDEVISKMVVALADDSEVKKSFKIISPEEASNLIHSSLEPYVIPENINKVVIFGDIHGCYTPLKQYFDKNPFNENTNYIFCGDYLDRGIENKEVLEFLISLKDKKNCVFIEGNHEQWLKLYSQKDYNIEEYLAPDISYMDFYAKKVVAQLKDKLVKLQKQKSQNEKKREDLSQLLKEARETNPETLEVFYCFEKVNVPQEQEQINKSIKTINSQVEKLQSKIISLTHEVNNTQYYLQDCLQWYKETFGENMSLNITSILEKHCKVTSNKKANPIKSNEFIRYTYPQIKDINKKDIREFCNRLAQMSYFTFNSHDYLVTHAGVPCLPTIKTQSIEFIKGVGKYEEHELIDRTFYDLSMTNKDYTIQIHGHRNVMRVPTCTNSGNTFNLEGQVEFGGHLRILELTEQGYNIVEIKNDKFNPPIEEKQEEKSDLDFIKEMYHSKWIQVKNLNDNVVSFNFTRDAFEKDHWNTHTCTARGLFVHRTNGEVVCRSYDKFFNHRQTDATTTAGLKQNFVFPVIGYKKENGFLGLISKHKGNIYFFTKSSDEGDFVNWFIGVLYKQFASSSMLTKYCMNPEFIEKSYTELYNLYILGSKKLIQSPTIDETITNTHNMILQELRLRKDALKEYLQDKLEEGYTYIFECVDPSNDPHIIKYDKPITILLDVVKNNLKSEFKSYEEVVQIANQLKLPVKQKELEFKNWEEFETWKNSFTQGLSQWDCNHEGYVFQDVNGFRVKFKSSFYKFWKQMRAIKDGIASGRGNRKIYKTKEEIQAVKLMEGINKEDLKQMSIIDIEDKFYETYKN